MVIPPWDYQGPLSSGVGLPSSLSVLTLTPGRTWALSSPYLRPGSSHQVPSFSETCMCDRLSVLFSPQGLPRPTTGAGFCGFPSVLTQGPLSPPSGTSPCVQSGSGILASPHLKPSPLYQGLISPRPRCQEIRPCLLHSSYPHNCPGLTTEMSFSEVSSDWSSGSSSSSSGSST